MTDEKTHPFQMRVAPSWLAIIDKWRRTQEDLPSRAESIRRLVGIGLKGGHNTDTLSEGCVGVPDATPEQPEPVPEVPPQVGAKPPVEASEPLMPPLDLPPEMREKIAEYRDSRPWFTTDDDAIRDLIKRGLELAEGRDDMVELDEEQVRQLRHLYPKGELGPIISGMVATGIRTALLNREDDK